ncbi:MAG: glycoside hydrolase family 38 N-terminal domain-containing protein, partial [Candidatus Heimdallarchaeaceae archaeon]
FEIRPERKEELLKHIKKGNIAVGPWYLLPDEWLVSAESLVRNLEISFEIAKEFDIPLMKVGYLPDQFGHSQAIPQILGNLTSISSSVLWRGVGKEINTVPFTWKSHENASSSILGVYMPYGYGNASNLSDEIDILKEQIDQFVDDLKPYSPFPLYLLMNGTDHQFPKPTLMNQLDLLKDDKKDITLCILDYYVEELVKQLEEKNYQAPEYYGEFRSSARAHLLQDTYSARMWIKQWNQKIEDKLVNYAEPLSLYSRYLFGKKYPESYLILAWKWLLKNHPHDSICGCSVDQTHEEMRSRFNWAESISDSVIKDVISFLKEKKQPNKNSTLIVFNPSNYSETPSYFEFTLPLDMKITGLKSKTGEIYEIQPLSSSEEIIFEDTLSPVMVRTGIKLLPSRKLPPDYYINDFIITEGEDPTVCKIIISCDKEPIGDYDIREIREKGMKLLENKKYKKFHVKAALSTQQTYAAIVPLNPRAFTEFEIYDKSEAEAESSIFDFDKNAVENKYYRVEFKSDGTFDLFDKNSQLMFKHLHQFEDFGDRGDEYTFGRLEPDFVKTSQVKRTLSTKGDLYCEIEQNMTITLLKELSSNRKKRIGKVSIPLTSVFRFYRDLRGIDIITSFTNKSKDHRFRVCFDLPFESKETLTSTHFGYVKRQGYPIGDDTYAEMPSGIQAQQRFIRVENPKEDVAITLMNKGLPEVELANNSRLALTLIRSVGFLSRADFPERPLHAGPFLETPGAQEINTEYTFGYSFMTHSKEIPIHYCANQAESFVLEPQSIFFKEAKIDTETLAPLITVDNSWIRISSLRQKENVILVTLYNLSKENQNAKISVSCRISKCCQLKLEGTKIQEFNLTKSKIDITFNPLEIKLLQMS